MKKRIKKEVGRKDDWKNGEAVKLRQRKWAKNREYELREYLNKLGHKFDLGT